MWFNLTVDVHREKGESLDSYMFTIISIYPVKMNPKWVYIGRELGLGIHGLTIELGLLGLLI